MPNQNNFRTNIISQPEPRFSASRIVKNPSESILYEELPASFGFDKEDTLELHFYTIPGNQLILSTTVRLDENIVKSHIVAYDDNTYKNYLRIDFTKLFVDKNLVLIPGDYRLSINFFSDEIGSYDNRKLTVDVISPSRTELQVSFNDTTDQVSVRDNFYLTDEFLQKSFNKPDAIVAGESIFTGPTGMQATDILNKIQQDTVNRLARLELLPSFQIQIVDFLHELFNFLREEIVIKGDSRIQETQYRDYIYDVVKQQINKLQSVVDARIQIS